MKGCVGVKRSLKISLLAWGCAMAITGTAAAADTLLAQTELQLEKGRVTAELWGDRLPNGYSEDLLVLLKDERGKLVTAFAPSIKGGYHHLLQAVQVKPVVKKGQTDNRAQAASIKGETALQAASTKAKTSQQLLISVSQGDWQAPCEFRVLDFANVQKVIELFGSADSMGLVSNAYTKNYINEEKLHVILKDGQQNVTALPQGMEGGKLYYGGLHSLTVHDVDGDGQQELLGTQQLLRGRQNVADVGVIWQLDEANKWKNSNITIMTTTPTPKSNTVNDGMAIANGTGGVILPRKIVVPGGEATYPIFVSQQVKLQNEINQVLAKECQEYLTSFYKGKADMAFKVIQANAKLISLQLISGKTSFIHHHVNIDPQTGKLMRLEQILNTQDPDLLPLLRLLNNNKNVMIEQKLPAEWYIEGNNLFLQQRICGKDELAGFALGNLHKFIKDKAWLEKKSD